MSTGCDVPSLAVRTQWLPEQSDLLCSVTGPSDCAWVRSGYGLVGQGVATMLNAAATQAMPDTRKWWAQVVAQADVVDDVAVPGSGLVAFASFRFAERAGIPGGVVVVPRRVFGRSEHGCWVTDIEVTSGSAPPQERPETLTCISAPSEDVCFRDGALSADAWQEQVQSATQLLQTGQLAKVVLAREVLAALPHDLPVPVVLRHLATQYPKCWAFHVAGLVGATPELLIRLRGGHVLSRVLAGTVPTTANHAADEALLAASTKFAQEHQVAVDSVANSLTPLVSDLQLPQRPSALVLTNVTHLATDVQARVPHGTHVLDLVQAVHPTAAVCGTPRAEALSVIDQVEHMDRSRYAGPVGWLDAAGDGEFGIALRCAEYQADEPQSVRLFAGCGIMADSEPSVEVAESDAKLRPMKDALRAACGADQRHREPTR